MTVRISLSSSVRRTTAAGLPARRSWMKIARPNVAAMRIPAVRPISFQPVKKMASGPKPSRTSRGPACRTTAPTPIGAGRTASPAATPCGCTAAPLTGPASLAMAVSLLDPRAAPSPICADELVCLRGPPRPRRIALDRGWLIQQRLDDAPCLLDAVPAHEVGTVAVQRGLQQHLVGRRPLAALGREVHVEPDLARAGRVGAQGVEHDPDPRRGVHLYDDLAGRRA